MKARTLQLSMIATALLALSAVTTSARADDARSEWRRDSREIHQDRRELRNDYRELAEDRADYRRAQARGDVFGMLRERMEIRQDLQEIRRDRSELRHDLRDRWQDARGHQDHGRHWGELRNDRHDRSAARHDVREDRTLVRQAQGVNGQGSRQQHMNPAAVSPPANAQQNNGRHLGWQQGRGNPHRS